MMETPESAAPAESAESKTVVDPFGSLRAQSSALRDGRSDIAIADQPDLEQDAPRPPLASHVPPGWTSAPPRPTGQSLTLFDPTPFRILVAALLVLAGLAAGTLVVLEQADEATSPAPDGGFSTRSF